MTHLDDAVLIGDHSPLHPVTDGAPRSRGAIPRDWKECPVRPFRAVDMPLIPQAEWAERIRDKIALSAQLSDIRLRGGPGGARIPSLDQNGKGYCWAHSSVGGVMLMRALMGLPYVALSAYAIAATIKSGRDEGGWGAQSLDYIIAHGVPSQAFWAQGNMDYRKDRPGCWEDAAKHKVTESWMDAAAPQYSRNVTWEQYATLLLCNEPTVTDLNWWGHSVLGLDLVDGSAQRLSTRGDSGKLLQLADFDSAWGMNDPVTAGFGSRILNSWSDSWSDRGMGILTGSKAVPDGAVALRVATASE